MCILTPFDVYKFYISVKMHFARDGYDCFRYNFKSTAKHSTFESRHDKYFFAKIAKKKDPKGHILANVIQNNVWIGDMVGEEADRHYTEWMRRNQSLTYTFKQELKKLNTNFNDNITVVNGQHPVILKLFLQGEISIETIAIVVDMTRCAGHWRKQLEFDPVWNIFHLRILKYIPFITYDKKKMREIVLETFEKEEA